MNDTQRRSMDFGRRERVLNYACQTYQLSCPSKVGAVMELIRRCQPTCFDEWEAYYFAHAHTAGRHPVKITPETLQELGERLYAKITQVVIPEWQAAFAELTEQDCIDYIRNLTLNRTYDGYVREKSIVNDGLAKEFPDLHFEETDPELDHAGDVDYVAQVGDRCIGIQIKPITASANFGGFSLTERMKASFRQFTEQYGGKVFVVLSLKGEIANPSVIDDMRTEVKRLRALAGTN